MLFFLLKFQLFSNFSTIRLSKSTLPGIFCLLWHFFLAQTSITRFFTSSFPKFEKLNISATYKSIIIIFSVNLPLVFIYKFRKKEIQLQPPGEPREHRLGQVLQGRSKSKFNIILSFIISIFLSSSGILINFKPTIWEPREHRLGEVLQGRSKSKLNIILPYSIFLSGFHNPNYFEIKKFLARMFQNISIGNFQLPRKFLFHSDLVATDDIVNPLITSFLWL